MELNCMLREIFLNQMRVYKPHAQFAESAESAKLEQAIKANLRGLGYGE